MMRPRVILDSLCQLNEIINLNSQQMAQNAIGSLAELNFI